MISSNLNGQNDLKWPQMTLMASMSSNDLYEKLPQMNSNDVKWLEITKSDFKWPQWPQVTSNDFNGLNDFKWSLWEMTSSELKWHQITANYQKWPQVTSNNLNGMNYFKWSLTRNDHKNTNDLNDLQWPQMTSNL